MSKQGNKEDNNFDRIDEYKAPPALRDKIYQSTQGNISFVRMVFNILDLYISKAFESMVQAVKDDPPPPEPQPLAMGMPKGDNIEKDDDGLDDDEKKDGEGDDKK